MNTSGKVWIDGTSDFKLARSEEYPTAVRFESVERPGWFLRHQGFTIKLHPDDESELFKADSAFLPRFSGSGAPVALSNIH